MEEIVIVGAGLAGLECARELLASFPDIKVHILEAAPCVGGRVCTMQGFFEESHRCIEIGAEFIHGTITRLHPVAAATKQPLKSLFPWSQGDGGPADEPAGDGGTGYYAIHDKTGYKVLRADETSKDEAINACHEALWSISEMSEEEITAEGGTLDEFLERRGITGEAKQFGCAGYANTAGGSADKLSMPIIGLCERCWARDGDDEDYRADGPLGMSFVSRALCERLGLRRVGDGGFEGERCRLDLSWVVGAIEEREGGVEVVNVDGERRVIGSGCVVCVPPPSLSRLRFEPRMDEEWRAALGRLDMSDGVKVILGFRQRCWPEDAHGCVVAGSCKDQSDKLEFPEMWFASADGVGDSVEIPTTYPDTESYTPKAESDVPLNIVEWEGPKARYAVTLFAMGDRAQAVRRADKARVVQAALCQIQRLFNLGATTPGNCIGAKVVSWAESFPHIGGGYVGACAGEQVALTHKPPILPPSPTATTTPVRGSKQRQILAKPRNRICFAGEATAGAYEDQDSPATLHGAMQTGYRAAHEIAHIVKK